MTEDFWSEKSPGIWMGQYEGWAVTKIALHNDVYGVTHYQYIAILGKLYDTCRLTAKTWPKLKQQIVNQHINTLF